MLITSFLYALIHEIDDDGKHWYFHPMTRLLHREDGPAVISYGNQQWWFHGDLHREDGPALIEADGCMSWFQNSSYHRDDGPAFVHPDGSKCWFEHGRIMREEGPVSKLNKAEKREVYGLVVRAAQNPNYK